MATIDGDPDISDKVEAAKVEDEEEEEEEEDLHKLIVLAGELKDEEGQEEAFDLVAVHGLFEGSRETWTEVDETKTWLESNVYETYPNARMMAFGYDNDDSKDGISARASFRAKALQLLEELLELRKELKPDDFRPLVFLAHDIGGIIVKEALCIATQDYTKWSSIVHSTKILFFFGTLHRAQSKWDMEDCIGKFLFANSTPISSTELIKELSRSIMGINESFMASKIPIIAKIADICSDIEDVEDTREPEEDRGQGFEVYTSILQVAFEDGLAMTKSHKNLTKMINYDNLYGLIDDALVSYSPPSSSNDDSTRCLQAFQALAVPVYPLNSLYTDQDRFTWIREDKTYLDFFEDKTPNIIHIQGTNHEDLSYALEEIYQHLEVSTPAGIDRQETEILLWWTFNKHDDRANTMIAMLNTFLAQIYSHNNELYKNAIIQFAQMCYYRSWTLPQLLLAFRLILVNATHRGVLCVINGLDECNESQCTEFLMDICDLASNTERRFKMVFGSRGGSHIMSELEGWPQIDMSKPLKKEEDEEKDEFALQVDAGVLFLLQQVPALAQFESTIKKKLLEHENDETMRTLLLAQIRNLKMSMTKAEIQNELDTLTATTPEEMFTFMLDRVPAEKKPWARKAILWILFSRRPLSVAELGEALVISADVTSLEDDMVFASIEQAFEETFRGLFVVSQNGVHAGHPSLMDFFLAEHEEGTWYDVKASAHQEISVACLSYLALPQVQKWITEKLDSYPVQLVETPIFEPRDSLHEYAITYWPKHYLLISESLRPISRVLELARNTKVMRNWSEAHWLFSHPITRRDRSFDSPLPVFAGVGLEDIVEKLVKTKEPSAKDLPKDCGLALIEAVRNKHAHLVSTLLKCGRYDQACLQEALVIAASHCHSHILTELINFAHELYDDFKWPGLLLFRVSQCGLTRVLRQLLKLGMTIKDAEAPHGMTPLHMAARQGHSEIVKLLLEHGADPMVVGKYGRIPLQTASISAHPNVVKILIKAGSEINFLDEDKDNALDLAAQWGNFKVVEALVEGNIDIDRRDNEGKRLPLAIAGYFGFYKCTEMMLKHTASTEVYSFERWTPLRYATSNNRVEMCKLLLEAGADPNTTEGGEPILGDCAAKNYLETVKLLVDNGAKIDTGSSVGWNALQRACQGGHTEVVTYLLDHGADINHRSKSGQTAILIAASNNQSELVKLLIEKGGDPHPATEAGWTAIHCAYDNEPTTRALLDGGADLNRVQNKYTPLFMAAANNCIDTVRTLLEFRADTEIPFKNEEWQNNYTPLTVATTCGYAEVVELLLEAGANVNHRSENGCVPTEYALTNNKEDVLRILLEYNPDLSIRDDDGSTALNCIGKSTELSLVKRLVNAGSPLEIRDNENYTPLCTAVIAENLDIVKYLIKKKAKLEVSGMVNGSPLHIAAHRLLMDIAKALVEAGADVNEVHPTIMGNPLQAAARCWISRNKDGAQEKMIRYLVEEGKADVKVVGGSQGCALNAVCGWASAEMVKLLLERGAKVDVPDPQGRVAIHYAAQHGLEHFLPIVSAGADVEVKDKMERSALHWAASGGKPEVVERIAYLSRSLVDQPDVDGWTPLLWAARQRGIQSSEAPVSAQKQIINFLIGQGADPCVVGKTTDGKKWSTVKIARYQGVDEEVVELLISKIKEKLESEGRAETWDDSVHASAKAKTDDGSCDGCLSAMYGISYHCKTCLDFDFCYKCYNSRRFYHADHEFDPSGEEYEEVDGVTNAEDEEEEDDTDDDTDDDESGEHAEKSSTDEASKEQTETNGNAEEDDDDNDGDDDDDDSD